MSVPCRCHHAVDEIHPEEVHRVEMLGGSLRILRRGVGVVDQTALLQRDAGFQRLTDRLLLGSGNRSCMRACVASMTPEFRCDCADDLGPRLRRLFRFNCMRG